MPAVNCGEEIGRYLNGKGQVVIILPGFQFANHNLRARGCQYILKERYPDIKVIDMEETQANQEKTHKVVRRIIEQFPGLDLIYITEGNTPSFAAKAIMESPVEGRTGNQKDTGAL